MNHFVFSFRTLPETFDLIENGYMEVQITNVDRPYVCIHGKKII